MEAIVQGPHPPVLSFMSGNRHYSQFLENRKVSEFSKIENISILENETRKLMDTHWRDASMCPLLQSEPSIGQHVCPLNQWEDSI